MLLQDVQYLGSPGLFSCKSLREFNNFHARYRRRREELWGTLDQALSLFVVGCTKKARLIGQSATW